MKNLLIICVILLLPSWIFAQEQETTLKLYGIKSGIIDYKFSGTKEGSGTLYFDEFGQKSQMYIDAIENGKRKKGWTLGLGETHYLYDPESSSEGLKMGNPIIKKLKNQEHTDMEAITAEVYSKMGFKKEGKQTFLDKECDVWKGKKGMVLIWNGILLKMEYTVYGYTTKQEATTVSINVTVDPKLFEIPNNIQFTEMPGF